MTRAFRNSLVTRRRERMSRRPQAETLESRLLLTAGTLDLSFDNDGYILAGPSEARAVLVEPNDNIVAVGATDLYGSIAADFKIARYLPDGAPDPTFGTNGVVTTDFAGDADAALDVARLSDGRLVVVGKADTLTTKPKGNTSSTDDAIAIALYLPSGQLDTSFSGDGKLTLHLSTYASSDPLNRRDTANGVAVDAQDRILVAGIALNASGNSEAVIARYLPDGTLDSSFSGDGLVRYAAPGFGTTAPQDVLLDASGNLVVLEVLRTSVYAAGVSWFLPDGTLDTSFGANGRTTFTIPARNFYPRDFVQHVDGSFTIAGSEDSGVGSDIVLARLLPSGAPDPSFGPAGIRIHDLGHPDETDALRGAALDPGPDPLSPNDDLVIGVGMTNLNPTVSRYRYDGTLDTTFGTNGYTTTVVSNNVCLYHAAALQSGGQVIAVGYANQSRRGTTIYEFLVARYHGTDTGQAAAFAAPASNGDSVVILLAAPEDVSLLDEAQIRRRRRPPQL